MRERCAVRLGVAGRNGEMLAGDQLLSSFVGGIACWGLRCVGWTSVAGERVSECPMRSEARCLLSPGKL